MKKKNVSGFMAKKKKESVVGTLFIFISLMLRQGNKLNQSKNAIFIIYEQKVIMYAFSYLLGCFM